MTKRVNIEEVKQAQADAFALITAWNGEDTEGIATVFNPIVFGFFRSPVKTFRRIVLITACLSRMINASFATLAQLTDQDKDALLRQFMAGAILRAETQGGEFNG